MPLRSDSTAFADRPVVKQALREVCGKETLGATRLEDIEHGVHEIAPIQDAWSSCVEGTGKLRFEQGPFSVRQVAGVGGRHASRYGEKVRTGRLEAVHIRTLVVQG